MVTVSDRLNIVADMLADEGFQPRTPTEPAAIQLAAMECRKVAAELEAAPAPAEFRFSGGRGVLMPICV